MSRYTYLLDPGHGGIIDGVYQTSGKRSPEWDDREFPDGSPYVLYEGVNNRDVVNRILNALSALNISTKDIVDSESDIGLTERSNRANELHKESPCVLISIHSNAYGSGWTSPTGIDIFIYNGSVSEATKNMQTVFCDKVKAAMNGMTEWRGAKAENFAILRQSNCSSILIEGGFHSNKDEVKLMLTEEWKEPFVQSIVDAIQYVEENGLGGTPTEAVDEADPTSFTIPARGYFKNGDRGPEVKQIQEALDARGCWTYHTFTEYYGDVTEAAVKEYQSSAGLTVDGLVGTATLSALGLI
ncbi:MAG: N-acetylmuramoyl-L-alanine amidase [Crocinitomicaceae bacterium]|nr:N-acetylmuramoyl-L-alanine amidase [Crocinitomicaceae bacterium]